MARLSNSISGVLLTRALGLLLVVCLAECAAGSCLSYGHSCWGAHGKRSGPRASRLGAPVEGARPSDLADRWFFSRLLRPQLAQREADLPLLALALNRQALDGRTDLDMLQRQRILKENSDLGDNRRDFITGKISSSEIIEDQMAEDRGALDALYMDDSRSDKALQALNDNTAGFP